MCEKMISSDLICVSGGSSQSKQKKYVLVWAGLEVMEEFYEESDELAVKRKREYSADNRLSVDLYRRVE